MDIIELLKSAFMGLVEGITEWLPVSSTGHMILVDEFVKMNVSETFWNMFLVVIQLGAILAVCVLFFHELNPFSPSKGKEGRRDTWVLWGKIVLGCIPAAAIGLPLNDWMEEHFYNAPVVALALIVYGVLFIVIENWRASKREEMAVAGSFGSRAVVSGGRPAGAHFAAPAAATAEDEDDDENLDFGSIATLEDLSWKTALGIGCFGLSLVFQLVTLPVEFNASHRALQTLENEQLLYDDELPGARKVLKAAALLMSALQLLRYVLIFVGRNNRGRRDN